MLLPFRSKNPPESFPWATIGLIAVNVIVYCATSDNLLSAKRDIVMEYGLSLDNISIKTMFTSMFLHAEPLHLLGNMWFLYLLGFAVEGRLRTVKFLILYFLAGLCGDLLHTGVVGPMAPHLPSIGASGAIMGILGAALYMFPFGQMNFVFGWSLYWRVITWPMWGVGAYYLGLNVLETLLFMGKGGVATLAHLGGAAGGYLICLFMQPKRDNQEASQAKAMLADTQDLRVLSSRELASMAESNPTDTALTLNWMSRSLKDGAIKPECMTAFMQLLPKIIAEQPTPAVGFVLGSLSMNPGVVPPHFLIDVGIKLEKEGEYVLALRLYDAALRDPATRPADQESALFKLSMLCESALNNPQRAMGGYQRLVQQFPMSHFADQAKVRLGVLTAKYGSAPSLY